ncbi:hypothetical protein [uncultured Methylophaga sp.]|uniref:hypothetical protein n=1 Tax=uncultured Methylophaga sp. TaxID=285271 RepID=UPI00260954E3|nr:hypothetical protein [uncultured Methylophaga sp.]
MEDYDWMLHRSNKMQYNLGHAGIYGSYRPPYQNVVYSNYPIILNMLPDLRNALNDQVLSGDVASQYAHALREVLIRHIGETEDRINYLVDEIMNPLKWFREGVKEVVSIPVYLLSALGILSKPLASNMLSSSLFSVLSGVVALISFLSALVTIGLGWEQFSQKIIALI